MTIVDDFICPECKWELNNIDKEKTPKPVCEKCGAVMGKNWANCRASPINRGEPTNARLCNDGRTINRFFAKDDPLCQIEMGLKRDGFSGLRTFSNEQAKYFREKAQKGEDSTKLRQEILDTRARNESEKKYKKNSKLLGV